MVHEFHFDYSKHGFSGRLNRCKAKIRVTVVKNSLLREYVASANTEKETKKIVGTNCQKKKLKKEKS